MRKVNVYTSEDDMKEKNMEKIVKIGNLSCLTTNEALKKMKLERVSLKQILRYVGLDGTIEGCENNGKIIGAKVLGSQGISTYIAESDFLVCTIEELQESQ